MDEQISVSRADLEAVRNWREANGIMSCKTGEPLPWEESQCFARMFAALTPPEPPWSPSDADIDAYCEALELDSRGAAKADLITARLRGFDAVPRRLSPEPPTPPGSDPVLYAAMAATHGWLNDDQSPPTP